MANYYVVTMTPSLKHIGKKKTIEFNHFKDAFDYFVTVCSNEKVLPYIEVERQTYVTTEEGDWSVKLQPMEIVTYELLISRGEQLSIALEGTCTLYRYDGIEYVVLSDNTVITREEDNEDNPIFPY